MIDLSNRIAIVTGGTRGIGEACVKLFVEANAKVAFTYKNSKSKAVALEKEYPGKVKAYKVDMESESDITGMVNQTAKDFGRIDILVHNAGIWNDGDLENMTLAHWEETIKVNLTSTYIIAKACAVHMKKNKFGRIILVSSTAGQRGESFHSHYAASKGGIISFTKSLAVELAPEYGLTPNPII